jgi:ElaB/YqjD/DUF883 family membrane-anchored ribosome-binding protein
MSATYKTTAKNVEEGLGSAVDQLAEKLHDGGEAAAKVAETATERAKQTLADAGDAARGIAGSLRDAGEDAMADGRSRLSGALRKAQDTAADAKDSLVAAAESTLTTVKDAAVEKADAARETLSDVGDRLAETLQRASTDGDGDALKSRVLTSVAQGLTTASDALRQRSVADLATDVRTLARRHPGAFMAAAAVVGFAAARFVRSSSHRHHDGQGPRV